MATQNYQKKEFNMVQVMALWKRKSEKTGKEYFTGMLTDENIISKTDKNHDLLVAFYNNDKKNPKEPDLEILKKRDLKDHVCSLWCNATESGKQYLTGKFDGKRVVGFINKNAENNRPYISVYYSDEQKKEEPKKAVVQNKF